MLADRPSLEELARNPAVQLFAERAQSVNIDFALTEENALEVAEVCVNLNGLPLVIELAAGRVSLFPPRILLSKLGQQLKGKCQKSGRGLVAIAFIQYSYGKPNHPYEEHTDGLPSLWFDNYSIG